MKVLRSLHVNYVNEGPQIPVLDVLTLMVNLHLHLQAAYLLYHYFSMMKLLLGSLATTTQIFSQK